MFLKFFGLFCLYFFFIKEIQSYDTIDCSTTSIYSDIHAKPLAFLETPSFPKNNNRRCKIGLITTTSNNIWVAMLNGVGNMLFEDGNDPSQTSDSIPYNSNSDILTYTATTNKLNFIADTSDGSWAAVQAVATTFDPTFANYSCPFSGETFDFTVNPEMVIPICPSYYENGDDNENIMSPKYCNWNFTLNSESQMLKVVVKNLNLDEDFSLSLIVDGETVEDFPDIFDDNFQVYYVQGSTANIKLSSEGSDGNFFFLVSAVETSSNYTSEGCTISQNPSGYITNGDHVNGYPPYQSCQNTIIVQENFESQLTLTESYLEDCCDTLGFANGYTMSLQSTLTLTSKANGDTLYFTSDGNTQAAGYKVYLETYKCECNNPDIVLDCDNPAKFFPMKNTLYYCSNITCDFKILPNKNCSNKYFYATFPFSYDISVNFTVDENSTQINQNNNLGGYYSQKSNISFTFSSKASPAVIQGTKSWYGTIDSFSPSFIKFNLNETKTKHLLLLADMKSNDAVNVCADFGILEIYISDFDDNDSDNNSLSSFQLFDGNDLTATLVGNLYSVRSYRKKSSTGCFTVYSPNVQNYGFKHVVLFKILDNDTLTNCDIDSSVIQIYGFGDGSSSSFQSSAEGSCEIDFLSNKNLYDIFPRVRLEKIIIISNSTISFSSIFEDKSLFKLNTTEGLKWQDFDIYTPGFTMIIPPSSNVTIYFNGVYYDNPVSNSTNIIQKGILTSPSYNGFNQIIGSTVLYQSFKNSIFENQFHQVTFSFKERYGNPNVTISADAQNITLVNNITTLELYNFKLIYDVKDFSKNEFLIEFITNWTAIPSPTTPYPTETTTTNFSFDSTMTDFTFDATASTSSYFPPTELVQDATTAFSNRAKIQLVLLILSIISTLLNSSF